MPTLNLSPLSYKGYAARPSPCFLQSAQWARFKERSGWSAHYFDLNEISLVVLSRKVAGGIRVAYAPHAPPLRLSPPSAYECGRLLGELSEKVRPYLPPDTSVVRWDTLYERTVAPYSYSRTLKPAPIRIQPPNTTVVSLDKSADQLLAAMHSKTRYNIRLAERRGVVIRAVGVEEVPSWYAMYRETAARQGIGIHTFEYYRRLFDVVDRPDGTHHPQLVLLMAYAKEDKDEVVGGIIVALHHTTATYLYGASADTKRNLMSNYLLHWRALQMARERGCLEYDFFGIPPSDDPRHPMSGLYRFKVGFGGAIVHRAGAWDWRYRRISAQLFRGGERLREWYTRRLRHK